MEATIKTYNIFFDRDINSVVMEWHGYATSRQFKEGTELMLNTLIKHNGSKVLADIRDMTLIESRTSNGSMMYFFQEPQNLVLKRLL